LLRGFYLQGRIEIIKAIHSKVPAEEQVRESQVTDGAAYPQIAQIVDFYSNFYTQTQPLSFKQPRHHFVGNLVNQQLLTF